MKFKYYLNENRSEGITEEEFFENIKKDCSDIIKYYKKTSNFIYRGLRHSSKYVFVDPTKQTRKSANTSNHYTILFDKVLPSWKKYPKRSKSLICSMKENYADGYGHLYIVFPFNNTLLGVCPGEDLWDSFYNLDDGYEYMLDDFNRDLIKIFKYFDIDSNDKTIEKNIYKLNDIIQNYKDIDLSKNSLYSLYDKKYKDKKDFISFLDHILSPQNNGFRLLNIGNNLGDDNEVWFSNKAYMTKISYTDLIYKLEKYGLW